MDRIVQFLRGLSFHAPCPIFIDISTNQNKNEIPVPAINFTKYIRPMECYIMWYEPKIDV